MGWLLKLLATEERKWEDCPVDVYQTNLLNLAALVDLYWSVSQLC